MKKEISLKKFPLFGDGFNPKKYHIMGDAFIHHKLLVSTENGFGIVTEDGKEIVPCIYSFGEDKSDGLVYKFLNTDNNTCHYFDSTGKKLFRNVKIVEGSEADNDVFAVSIAKDSMALQGDWKIVNAKEEIITDLKDKTIGSIREIHNGMAFAITNTDEINKDNQKLGIIDLKGNILIKK